MSEWQDISTAPKDGTAIWLWCDGHAYIGYGQPADPPLDPTERWYLKASYRRTPRSRRNPDEIFGTWAFDAAPTLWQPLPEPPK